ncbi:hypothetical protein DFH94DRAFT_850975 [Russula ochroleuca]|uniref:Uncharacterized protein n=1 Tax=Russula ochroleuca TaxID=152965 RepID=A0A9P5TCS5_9AGAM|nr:hypothetical protein DFH94DRAFT_850975 [Russula ochroleuca]
MSNLYFRMDHPQVCHFFFGAVTCIVPCFVLVVSLSRPLPATNDVASPLFFAVACILPHFEIYHCFCGL